MANKPGKVMSILADMKRIIEEGREWGQQGMIPPRTDLAKRYGVGTSTINDVFVLLHAQGYVLPQGRNVVVNPHRFVLPVLVPSFDKYMQEQGLTPWMQNVGNGPEIVTLSQELAAAFELAAGTKAVKRLRLQGEQQVIKPILETQAGKRSRAQIERVERRIIPYRLAETYYLYDMVEKYYESMKQDPMLVVINEIKRDTGKNIVKSHVTVGSRFATEQEQELLQITMYTPIIELFRKSVAQDETVIMFSRIVSPAHRFTLTFDAATPL